MFKVTYRNVYDNKRYTLLDQITEEEADELVARVSDKNDGNFYIPEARKEQDDSAA